MHLCLNLNTCMIKHTILVCLLNIHIWKIWKQWYNRLNGRTRKILVVLINLFSTRKALSFTLLAAVILNIDANLITNVYISPSNEIRNNHNMHISPHVTSSSSSQKVQPNPLIQFWPIWGVSMFYDQTRWWWYSQCMIMST